MISKYLKSACHGAPVVQAYEQATDLFPITCTACGQELGAPGGEDIPNAILRRVTFDRPTRGWFRHDLVVFKIGELIAARARTTAQRKKGPPDKENLMGIAPALPGGSYSAIVGNRWSEPGGSGP